MKYVTSLIILTTGFSSAHAVLDLNIEAYTSTALTFNITGTMGAPSPAGGAIALIIESPTNEDWILGTTSLTAISGSTASGSPIASQTLESINLFNGHSAIQDAFQLFFDDDLSTSSVGNGASITISLPAGRTYNTSILGDLALSWGSNSSGNREPSWGVPQSTSAVPEPSSSATIAAVLALAFVACKRR